MNAKKITRSEAWTAELERTFLSAHDEYTDALYRHCLIRIRDNEVAKDIVQETFAKTWVYLAAGNRVEFLRAFLYRVANNLIVDYSRKKKSSSLDVMIDDDGFEPIDEHTVDPSILPQTREAMKLLHSLDELYRTVITMRYIDELSPREIAKALNVSENVVSVRIHRGIERLGKLMRRHPHDTSSRDTQA